MKTSSNTKWKLDKIEKAKIVDYLLLEEVERADIDKCIKEVAKTFVPTDDRNFFSEVIAAIARVSKPLNGKFLSYSINLKADVRNKRLIEVPIVMRQSDAEKLIYGPTRAAGMARAKVLGILRAAEKKIFEDNRGMVGMPLQHKTETEFCMQCKEFLPPEKLHIFESIEKNARAGFSTKKQTEICKKITDLGFSKVRVEAIFAKTAKNTAASYKGFFGDILRQQSLQNFYRGVLKKLSAGASPAATTTIDMWMKAAGENVAKLIASGKFAPQAYEPRGLTELDKVELTDFIVGKFGISAKVVKSTVEKSVVACLKTYSKLNNGQLKRSTEDYILSKLMDDPSIDVKIRRDLRTGGAEKFFEQIESKDMTPFMGDNAKKPLESSVPVVTAPKQESVDAKPALQKQQEAGLTEDQIKNVVDGWVNSHRIPQAVADEQLRISDADGRSSQRHLLGNDYLMKITKNGLLRVLMQTGIARDVQISVLKQLLLFNGLKIS